jgi:hypothetical protein
VTSPASVLYVELVMSVDRIGEAARSAPSVEGEWPPAVVVAHVGDVDEQVWLPRIEQMVAAHDAHAAPPSFTWWEPDGDATYERYRDISVDDAIARTMAARISLLTRLRDLAPEQWAARGQHEIFGEMDIEAVVYAVLAHDEEHRASLLLPRPSDDVDGDAGAT